MLVRALVAGLIVALFASGALAAPPSMIGTWTGTIGTGDDAQPMVLAIGDHSFQTGPTGHEGYVRAVVTETAGAVVIEVPATKVRIEGRLSADGRSMTGKVIEPDLFANDPELKDLLKLLPKPPPQPVTTVMLSRASSEQPALPTFLTRLSGEWRGTLDIGDDKTPYALLVGDDIRLETGGRSATGAAFQVDDELGLSFGSNLIFIGKLSEDGQRLSGKMGPGLVTFPIEFKRDTKDAR